MIFVWNSVLPEESCIWLAFSGSGWWGNGFWVYHPRTSYLDVQMVEEGAMTVTYDGKVYSVPKGSLVMIPPGESKLMAASQEKCVKHHFGIRGKILSDNLSTLGLDKVVILPDFRNQEFDHLYAKLHHMLIEKNPETVREFCADTFKMLLLLSHCANRITYPEPLQRALILIDGFFSRNLSLEEICQYAQCRKSTLQSLFKNCLNSTPIRKLTEVRMHYAARILVNDNIPIKQIAEKCGFRDQLYFSAAFRRFWGCSPREYRKKNTPA